MNETTWRALSPARQRAGLSLPALYLRFVALGGTASERQLTAHVTNGAVVGVGDHDLAVLAINERFLELDDDERLPYEVPD